MQVPVTITVNGQRHEHQVEPRLLLVHFLGEENGQLFDLQADPDEVNNLWSNPKHAEKKQELLNVILEWRIRSTHIAGQWAAEFR